MRYKVRIISILVIMSLLLVQGVTLAKEVNLGLMVDQDGSFQGKFRYELAYPWHLQVSGPGSNKGLCISGLYMLDTFKTEVFVPYIGAGYLTGGSNFSDSLHVIGGFDLSIPYPGFNMAFEGGTDLNGDTFFGVSFMVKFGEKLPEEDVELLAKLIAAEANNQPFEGKIAVGAVVMNRIASSLYPNTIREVIYQSGQFTPVSNGRINRVNPDSNCYSAAKAAMAGRDPSNGALYFYNPDKSSQAGLRFMADKKVTVRIGEHVFCK